MKNKVKITNNPNDTCVKSIDLYDTEYYNLNKWMLSMFGQWPYQPRTQRKRAYFVLLYSCTVLGPQIRAMVFAWGRLDTFSECFSPFVTHVVCMIKLINLMLQQEKVKKVLDVTRKNWECTRNPSHINILKEYGIRGKNWTVMWIGCVYIILVFWLTLALLPKILDALRPLNVSRKTFNIIPTDYGVDQDEYWWWIQLHIWPGTFVFLAVLPVVDGFYMVCAQHICAMFEISSYVLENMIRDDEDIDVVLNPETHEDIYYRQVVSCIRKHKLIIQYVRNIASTNESCLLFIVGLNMMGLSVTGYQAVAEGTETDVAFRFAMFTIGLLVHLFVITLPGHWIMSSSSIFPNSVYSCKWYMMSLRTRRLIMLTMREGIEPCVITAGKVYVMSIVNFGNVLRTSMSYMAMLTSMQ